MTRTRSPLYWRNRKQRWEKRLRQLAQMRAAKERKRLENPPEHEPKMERYYRFEFGVRNKITGETAWHDLVSVRHASKALSLVQQYL